MSPTIDDAKAPGVRAAVAFGLTKHLPGTIGILLKGTAIAAVATAAHFGAGVGFKGTFAGGALGCGSLAALGSQEARCFFRELQERMRRD